MPFVPSGARVVTRAAAPAVQSTETDFVTNVKMENAIYAHIKKYSKSDDLKATRYLLVTFAGYAWSLCLPFYLFPIHSLFIMRLFVCFHDMGHGFYFTTRTANQVIGTLCGVLTSTSFDQWVYGHNEHHQISNDLNYPQYVQTAVFSVSQYKELSPFYQSVYKSVATNRPLLLTIMPIYISFVNPLIRAKNNHEKLMLLGYLYFLFQKQLLTHYYASLLFTQLVGFILFHSQHTFESAKRKKDITHFESAMQGASFLQVPSYLKWATAAIEYHHIHHLSVAIPLYNLRACHDEAPPGMFDSVKRITFWEGLEALKYTLYDEEKDSLISFDEYEAAKH